MKIPNSVQLLSPSPLLTKPCPPSANLRPRMRNLSTYALVNPFKQADRPSPKIDAPKVDFKPYIGAAVSVVAVLISQAQMSGSIQADIKALDKRFEQVDKQLIAVSKDISELRQQVSFLNGFLTGNAKGPVPTFLPSK